MNRVIKAVKSLPFESYVVGLINDGRNRTFVMVVRDHVSRPFLTYEINVAGRCVVGYQFVTRSEAVESMIERAGYKH